MGGTLSKCAAFLGPLTSLFGGADDDDDDDVGDDERLAVEELLQDAGGAGGYPVELTIECRDLPNKDKFSLSDPFVVIEGESRLTRLRGDERAPIGRTETVQDDLNPRFIRAVVVSFDPDEDTKLFCSVYHEAHPGAKDEQQQLLGVSEVPLKRLVFASPRSYTAKLRHPRHPERKSKATITLTANKIKNVQEEVLLELGADGVRSGRRVISTFVVIYRTHTRRLVPVARTNVAMRTHNPRWKPMHVKAYRLCENNEDLPLVLQVFAYGAGGKHKYIGSCRCTLHQLASGTITALPLINEHKVGRKGYTNSGDLLVHGCERKAARSFLEFVRSGYEFDCTIAVDLSASNGAAIDDTSSLHFKDPIDPNASPNDYTQVLRSVCRFLGRYDSDQQFPLYGFGAVPEMLRAPPPGTGNEGFFPITRDWNRVEVQGAEAITEAYLECIDHVEMVEPTNIAPLLRHVAQRAAASRKLGQHRFHYLVIITDGQFSDQTEAIDAVVEGSYLPMSVLIVGIGDPQKRERCPDGFARARHLDSANHHSVITGKRMGRDIVGFVAFHEYKGLSVNEFARGALREIPRHFLSWISMGGVDYEFDGESQHQNEQSEQQPRPESMYRSVSFFSPHSMTRENTISFARSEAGDDLMNTLRTREGSPSVLQRPSVMLNRGRSGTVGSPTAASVVSVDPADLKSPLSPCSPSTPHEGTPYELLAARGSAAAPPVATHRPTRTPLALPEPPAGASHAAAVASAADAERLPSDSESDVRRLLETPPQRLRSRRMRPRGSTALLRAELGLVEEGEPPVFEAAQPSQQRPRARSLPQPQEVVDPYGPALRPSRRVAGRGLRIQRKRSATFAAAVGPPSAGDDLGRSWSALLRESTNPHQRSSRGGR
eukprot:TRINITY_DN7425_c0_g1_i1.p1 TRINITY_DN7425_c0_g1~~TRINITY_DN7425_c0_g1_i1.p1  ORF type:complete len:886 (+),score=269.42 TRINITY_DN7425_c0_g1_i1:52-2709(+)